MTLVKNNSDVKEFIPRSFADLIDNFFKDAPHGHGAENKFLPRVDITEDEKKYEVHVSLPGMKKEDIQIEILEGKLTIHGERKLVKDESDKKYLSLETTYGSFQRSFYLPENANQDGIEAEYINGILVVSIPKDEKKTRKANIAIK